LGDIFAKKMQLMKGELRLIRDLPFKVNNN